MRHLLLLSLLTAIVLAAPGCAARNATPQLAEASMLAAGDNRHFSHTITVNVPAARIWAIWMDVSGWPTWDTELKEASASAPLTTGVEGRLIPVRGRASRFRVTMLEPHIRYAFDTDLPGATLRIARTIQLTESGCTFTHDVSFHGPLGRIFASRFGPGFRRALPLAMERLAAQAREH